MASPEIKHYKRTSNEFPVYSTFHPEPDSISANGYGNNGDIPLNDTKVPLSPVDLPPTTNGDKPSSSKDGGEVEGGENEKPPEMKMVGMGEVFRFSDTKDKLLIVFGIIFACLQGAAMPLMIIVFGEMSDLFIYDGLFENWMDEYWDNVSQYSNYTEDEVMDDPTLVIPILEELGWYDQIEAIEEYLSDDFLEQMQTYALYYTGIGAGVMIVAYLQVVCWQSTSYRQCQRIRTELFRAILKQQIGWFDTHEAGELNTRLTDDVDKIQDGIGEKLGQFFQYFSSFIAGFVVGFIFGWELTLVILAVSPLLVISGGVMSKLGALLTSKELKAYAKAGAVAEEVLSSIRTVTVFSGQKKEDARYTSNLVDAREFGVKKGFINGGSMGLVFFIMFCSYALAFWYGTQLYLEGSYSPGDILVVFFGVLIGAFSLGNAAPNIQNFATARGAAYAIYGIIDSVPSIDSSSTQGITPDDLQGNIEFKDVHFQYPSRPDVQVLQGLNLKVNVGETVALVGASGCGKSTTVQLLQRFYDTAAGQVLIDGNDIREYNIKWLRQHIGVVSQEPVLFQTTIEENIRYGNENVTEDEIVNACKMANAHDFIMKLPKKYQTMTGERGAQLSGGQKQRIAISRALVRDPKILLLDEATSALDTESEASVQAALDKASQGRTTIVIAHRLSTVRNADQIAGLDVGIIVEKGTHSELMQVGGVYHTLCTNQSQKKDEDELPGSPIKGGMPFGFDRSISVKSQGSDHGMRKRTLSQSSGANLERTLSATEPEEAAPEVPVSRIIKLNYPELPFIILGCCGCIVSGGIQPGFALVFAEILGVFQIIDPEELEDEANFYSVMFVLIGILAAIAMFTQSYCFARSGEYLTMRLRQMTFQSYLRQEISYFDDPRHNTGALCTRLATDASAIKGAAGVRMGMILQALSAMTCGLAIGFIFSWQLTLLLLAFGPFMMIAGTIQMKMMTGNKDKDKEAMEEAGKVSTEAIENIRTVATLTKENKFYADYYRLTAGPTQENLKRSHYTGLSFGFAQGIVFFAYAACFSFGAWLIEREELTYEDMYKVVMAIAFSALSVGQMSSFAPDYSKAKTSANTIFQLVDSEPEIDPSSEKGKKVDNVKGEVDLHEVFFNYPTRPNIPVLRGVDMAVKRGKTVALVGSSGCGKSTIIQLIERFYDPKSGEVRLDGADLPDLHIQWMRSQMGLVSQEPVLFDCSIADNISYGDNSREVPMNEIIRAAMDANIHNFITTLPDGYNTNVGDKGTQLSGGQKQRVAIARALVRNPKILLLDEATSALDTESEKVVQEALDKAQEGRTCITIAHRLSTIQNSDCILVIQNGEVVEMGKHSELISKKGFYYKLNNAQLTQA